VRLTGVWPSPEGGMDPVLDNKRPERVGLSFDAMQVVGRESLSVRITRK